MDSVRVGFFRIGSPVYGNPPASSLGLPINPPRPRTVRDIEEFGSTSGGNVGNYIHWDAMPNIIDRRKCEASFIDVRTLLDKMSPGELAERIDSSYDVVVLSTANFIRNNSSMGSLLPLLEAITTKLIVVGAGVQQVEGLDFNEMTENMQNFLRMVNRKASVFGTRGDISAEALHGMGLENARALGCPSIYAGLDGVLAVNVEPEGEVRRVVTAGHLEKKPDNRRFSALCEFLDANFPQADVSYLCQTEFKLFPRRMQDRVVVDARGGMERAAMDEVFFAPSGRSFPERMSFHCFVDLNAWRQFVSTHDLYVGDRIHGGVVCLQMGVPAVVVYADARVQELVDFFKLPGCSIKNLDGIRYEDLGDSIREMKTTVGARYLTFRDALEEAGLPTNPVNSVIANQLVAQ